MVAPHFGAGAIGPNGPANTGEHDMSREIQQALLARIHKTIDWLYGMPDDLHHRIADSLYETIAESIDRMAQQDPALAQAASDQDDAYAASEQNPDGTWPEEYCNTDHEFWDAVSLRLGIPVEAAPTTQGPLKLACKAAFSEWHTTAIEMDPEAQPTGTEWLEQVEFLADEALTEWQAETGIELDLG